MNFYSRYPKRTHHSLKSDVCCFWDFDIFRGKMTSRIWRKIFGKSVFNYFLIGLTHWLRELLQKNAFLNSLVVFRLDLCQIRFNLVKNAFATRQLAFLATSISVYDIVIRACAEITPNFGFSIFRLFVSLFLFFSFFFFLLQWLTFYWAWLLFKTSWRRAISTMEQPAVVAGNFFHSTFFFTQLFEHFCAYLRLHLADYSDLGIIGKIFSSCRSWVWMMPILVKSDNTRV